MRNLVVIISLIFVVNLSATIINIPADFLEIQDGIDAAVSSDTVLVHPGTYTEEIYFFGKDITVASLFLMTNDETHIDSTIITVPFNDYCVHFTWSENENSILYGFTLAGGNGIECDDSSPTIMHNKLVNWNNWGIRATNSAPNIMYNIFDCTASVGYNPFWIIESNPKIIGNYIFGNGSFINGIYLLDCPSSIISGNTITGLKKGISCGGEDLIINNLVKNCNTFGIECGNQAKLINNTIVNNHIGVRTGWDAGTEISNSIIWDNEYSFLMENSVTLSHNCLEGYIPQLAIDNGGNININPLFENTETYSLEIVSPCIESGTADTTGLNLPEYDLLGNLRIQDGNGDGISIIDMGCNESAIVSDPGFVTGTISLIGGNGNIEDVNVGIGAPIHPDINGYYQITFPALASPYNVTAWLDGYLLQTISDVSIISGQTTENINFELEYYQPETYLEFTPDSLAFIYQDMIDFKIKNISLIDINVNAFIFAYVSWTFGYLPYDLQFPQYLSPDDSLECIIYIDLPVESENREIQYDSLFVHTSVGQFIIPIAWDTNLINDIEDNTILLGNTIISNYPNPFNPSTTISFNLTTEITEDTEISIYNLKGQKVKTFSHAELACPESILGKGSGTPNSYSVIWNGNNDFGKSVSSGIYFTRLKAGKVEANCKMLLLK